MKKILTIILAIVTSLVACFSLVGCGEKVLTVGYTNVEPLNYFDEDGKLIGFDTELAEKIFTDLGYTVIFKEIDWNEKYNEINANTIDVIWNGFTANCKDKDGIERADKVDFSYNYMVNAQCIVRDASKPDLTDKAQFSEYKVAFEDGSAGATFVAGIDGMRSAPCDNQMAALMEVLSKTSDYAVVDYLLAKSVCGKGNFESVVINQGIDIPIEYYAIGFKKGSDLTAKVNAKLVELSGENGFIATLATKYNLDTQVITDFSDQVK